MGGLRDLVTGMVVAAALLTAAPGVWAKPAEVGLNFTGTRRGSDSTFIPPDTMGAVGPEHIVELINGQYRVYDKTNGAQLFSRSLNQFWSDAGTSASGAFAFDPRVVFDPASGRWFASSVDNAGGNNNFMVAVSDSANPLDGWSGFKIDSDTANLRWADFPQLGVNDEGVFITANMFAQTSGTTLASMVVVPKADLLAAVPTIANATRLQNIDATTNFSVQPVVDLDGGGMPAAMFSALNSSIRLSQVNGPVGTPTVGFTASVAVAAYGGPPAADQPGAKADIHVGDNRIRGSVYLLGGTYWGVQNVADPTSGNAAIRWFKIDAASNALVQEGLITDDSLDLIYPSLAVNPLGDVVIGFTGGSNTQFLSAYAVVGETVGGVTTFDDNFLMLAAGVSDYQRLDSLNRNRWGDFSSTVLDPSDPLHFWTFQEFVSATDQWAIRISEVVITPEPASAMVLGLGALCLFMRRARPQRAMQLRR